MQLWQALGYLESERPDAVILDIPLPNINGIEVLQEIRSRDATLPVIIVSGHGSEQQLGDARRLGVTEVISKPDISAPRHGGARPRRT